MHRGIASSSQLFSSPEIIFTFDTIPFVFNIKSNYN